MLKRLFDWVHAHNWKTGDWLELCYQQQHNDMLQATVRLEPCHYALKVRHIIEKKQALQFCRLQPHSLRPDKYPD